MTNFSRRPLILDFLLFFDFKILSLAKCDGRIRNASIKENNKQAITLKAISCIISISPPTNNNVENAKTVVRTDVKTALITSVVPSKAALIGDFPRSK